MSPSPRLQLLYHFRPCRLLLCLTKPKKVQDSELSLSLVLIGCLDKLHATRLLTVEEKPFKRLTKRLLAPTSPIQSFSSRLPTPPVDDDEANGDGVSSGAAQQKVTEDLRRFREDVILDFAAFESSIARVQFLRASNEKERQRYAAEKVKIEATAQAVRDNTAKLRIQLDEAQKTLAIRKTYDVLADKITDNKALKPRDEQHVNIEKLRTEIEDLERESKEHSQAWVDRREQFGRLVNESLRLRRLIRDEKEPEPEPYALEGNVLSKSFATIRRGRGSRVRSAAVVG